MAAPLTGFETHGGWTTLAEEQAFLGQITAETPATLATAGTSAQGRPIHRVDLGTGTDRTALIVCLQHGNEQASREAALTQLRDLAYSTDPATLAYLATHRLVWLPTVNPDGRVANTRQTAQGHNTNRDYFTLAAPETIAVVNTLRATGAHALVDAHEYWSTAGNWMGRGNALPGTHPAIQALGDDLAEDCRLLLRGMGYDAHKYGDNYLPRNGLSTVAGLHHTVAMLSESNAHTDTPPARVQIQRIILDTFREWHEANADACTAAQATSRQHALTTNDPYPLLTGEFLGSVTTTPVQAASYRLTGDPLPAKYIDTHGIQVTGDTVTMRQHARGLIPPLLDPASEDAVVPAERVQTDPRQLRLADGRLVTLMRTDGTPA